MALEAGPRCVIGELSLFWAEKARNSPLRNVTEFS